MTLPHGFGSSDIPPTENPHRCKFGKECSDGYGSGKCSIHSWIYHHDEAWMGIQFLIGISVATIIIIGILSTIFYFDDLSAEPFRKIIDGYNCNQLAEYVADRSKEYSYAEHRYEWLCVNEQIKEFKG